MFWGHSHSHLASEDALLPFEVAAGGATELQEVQLTALRPWGTGESLDLALTWDLNIGNLV